MISFIVGRIVGTPIGRLAKYARSIVELRTSGLESIGTIANDQLAEILLTQMSQSHFVDVGAHIGSIVAEVKVRCPTVRITAIEPIPQKVRSLRAKFKDIDVIECALSDYEGESSFFINPEESGYSSLSPDTGTLEIRVPVRRLDSIVDQADVIKIDVEGAELGVLRGS